MCFAPKIKPPPPGPQPEDANAAALRQRSALAGSKGFASTILTSPLGAPANAAASQQKTLLGG